MSTKPNTESNIENRENRIATDRAVRAAWLTPWHFKAGQSGNAGGRPEKKPVAEAVAWTGELPCPPTQRGKLEKKLGVELSQSLTLAQAVAIGQLIRAIADKIDGPMAAELRLGVKRDLELPQPPDILFQFVELSKDLTPVRVVDLEPPPPLGEEPPGSLRVPPLPGQPRRY